MFIIEQELAMVTRELGIIKVSMEKIEHEVFNSELKENQLAEELAKAKGWFVQPYHDQLLMKLQRFRDTQQHQLQLRQQHQQLHLQEQQLQQQEKLLQAVHMGVASMEEEEDGWILSNVPLDVEAKEIFAWVAEMFEMREDKDRLSLYHKEFIRSRDNRELLWRFIEIVQAELGARLVLPMTDI